MQILGNIRELRLNAFAWRSRADLLQKIGLSLVFAVLTGLMAQIRMPLPFTPVPVTGQTFAVLLAGVALGRRWGAASMVFYGALGLAGVPWFNGAASGLGATTGYIIGFVLTAAFVGYVTDTYIKARSFYSLAALMVFSTLVLVYLPGLLWLGGWLKAASGSSISAGTVISMGATPFIAGDVIKALAAAGVAWLLLPKTPFSEARPIS
jgi:biotin transport system substrate-specific component